ncbi:hypothetical protein [Salinibaculum salinum]|uniref:hypothetical protein n=1 Tax=Salinibaculum salinum TaxID=3131996 RepID=UPI0030EDD00A
MVRDDSDDSIAATVADTLCDADVSVAVASAAPWGSENSKTAVERYTVDGDRAAVREQAATRALEDLVTAVRDGK